MTAKSFDNIYIVCIEASLDTLQKFSQTDQLISSFQTQYLFTDISEFYKEKLHKKSPLDFLGAIFFTPLELSNRTIVLGNSGGWATLCNYICKNLGLKNFQFDMNAENSEVKRNSLFVNENGRIVRIVQSITNDYNTWEFSSKGLLQPFENPDNYKKRKIQERLNKEILIEYCIKYGLDVLNESFFSSDQKALYIQRNMSGKHSETDVPQGIHAK